MPATPQARVLHNRYHVLRPVGRGGMGAVYEAIDLRLQNTVAVKEMTAEGAVADEAFRREARLLAGLRHFALPVVIDYFVQDAARFLVMQYIDGEDLGALFRRRGPFDEREVQAWAVSLLHALVFLHGHRPPIVHRDIKPSNIKLTPRGEVVLLDFGLAKGRIAGETRLAGDDVSVFGFTPNYAPLEQLEGRGTDPRSDLFALGATLYHLVTGGAPPDASTRADALGAGQPDPVTSTLTSGRLSSTFSAVLARAMQLQADQRYPSAQSMLDALAAEPDRQRASTRVTPSSGIRRIDAAAPSRAEVGRDIDLLVQVRFTESPRLGLEDWPSKRRPAEIEQSSDDVRVEHPHDAATGRELPARLRVRVVAPDFDIRGSAEHLIDVPPDDYSKRIGFLLAPRSAGLCRINVEVYSAADAVYLGAVPVETEALAQTPADALVQAGGLVLGVVAAAREPRPQLSDTARVAIVSPEPPPVPEPPKTHPPRVVVAQPVPHAFAPAPQVPDVPDNVEAIAALLAERARRLEQADEVERERIRAQAARDATSRRGASARRRAAADSPVAPTASFPVTDAPASRARSSAAIVAVLAVVVIAGSSLWMVTRMDDRSPATQMASASTGTDPIAPPAATAPPAIVQAPAMPPPAATAPPARGAAPPATPMPPTRSMAPPATARPSAPTSVEPPAATPPPPAPTPAVPTPAASAPPDPRPVAPASPIAASPAPTVPASPAPAMPPMASASPAPAPTPPAPAPQRDVILTQTPPGGAGSAAAAAAAAGASAGAAGGAGVGGSGGAPSLRDIYRSIYRVQATDRVSVRLAVDSVDRRGSVLNVSLVVVNESSSAVRVSADPATTTLTAADGSTGILRRPAGSGPIIASAGAGREARLNLEFDLPPVALEPFRLTIGVPVNDTLAMRFPALTFRILQ